MHNIKFLIIEDDEFDRENYRRILKQSLDIPFEIFEAHSGNQALDLVEKQEIDCILLDYQLPDSNGLDLLKKIRKGNGKYIPVIMLTGQGNETIAVSAIKQGATDYINKNNIDSSALAKMIMNAVWNSKLKKIIQQQKKQLKYYAYYDSLTGLVNRHTFEEMAERELSDAKRFHHALAILFIDIDSFMAINDTLGHLAGDEILIEISNRLNYVLPKEAIVSRFGDDEFAILLTGINIEIYAATVARKIIDKLAEPYVLNVKEVKLDACIGISCYPDSGDTLNALLKNADIALTHAKQLGQGKFQFFSDDLNRIYQRKVELERALQNAVNTGGEFFLIHQPRFNMKTGKLVGIEVMLRWHHPRLGVLLPEQFMPIADKAGLVLPIGKWMLETATRQLLQLFRKHSNQLQLTIDIDLSPRQLEMYHLNESVGKLLQLTAIPASCIELSFTETAIMEYVSSGYSLDKFAGLSVQLVVSDFKIGYYALEKLLKLPLTSFKIDRFLVEETDTSLYKATVVKSLIQLGKDLALNTIADGVKTESQINFLREHGCMQAQGPYLAPLMSVDELEQFVIDHQ
jgi:diguanylate cyclase (GGDEF)-like protein